MNKEQQELLKCPLCGEADFDETGMAFHYYQCDKAIELRDAYRKEEARQRKERLKGFTL